jgi:hypothetical protein
VAEGNDGDLFRIRRCEIAHETVYLVERVVSRMEGGIGRRYDIPTCPGLTGGDMWTWGRVPDAEVMRARARGCPLDLFHAVAGARGQTEGQEPKLGLCDSTTGEVKVDVRMGYLPQIPFAQL